MSFAVGSGRVHVGLVVRDCQLLADLLGRGLLKKASQCASVTNTTAPTSSSRRRRDTVDFILTTMAVPNCLQLLCHLIQDYVLILHKNSRDENHGITGMISRTGPFHSLLQRVHSVCTC